MQNADDIFSYCLSFTNLERHNEAHSEYKLHRMRRLLDSTQHPEKSFKSIHIAGSKGKGSTAAFLASLFSHTDRRVGIYASPHIRNWRERIGIKEGEKDISPDPYLIAVFSTLQNAVKTLKKDLPTTFELLTLLAFLSFKEAKCEWAIIETGLGGRLDATNLIMPQCTIITSIELEHQDYLGNSLASIAGEKAGIIKQEIPIIIPPMSPPIFRVIKTVAQEKMAPLYSLASYVTWHHESEVCRYTFQLEGEKGKLDSRLGLKGSYQEINAGLALLAYLLAEGEKSTAEMSHSLEIASLPGRSEFIDHIPPLLLDGAHTPESIEGVCKTFSTYFPQKSSIVFGLTEKKQATAIFRRIKKYFSHLIITTAGNFKPFDPYILADIAKKEGLTSTVYPEANQALKHAMDDRLPTLVTGSFHLIGDIQLGEYIFEKRVYCLKGDISRIRADCIVNAANSSLLGGGGVDGILHERGGPHIIEACRRIRDHEYPDGLPCGEAVATTAGDLAAKHLIHTVGPVWRGGKENEDTLLINAYANSLTLARSLAAKSIAFPSISTGAYAFPKSRAFHLLSGFLSHYCNTHASPALIYLVFFQSRDLENFLEIARTV